MLFKLVRSSVPPKMEVVRSPRSSPRGRLVIILICRRRPVPGSGGSGCIRNARRRGNCRWVAQQRGHRELVVAVLHPFVDAVAIAGIPVERQVGRDALARAEIEFRAEGPPLRIERLLVESAGPIGVGVGGNGVEQGDTAIVEEQVVDFVLRALTRASS